jgi:hypothetical protein
MSAINVPWTRLVRYSSSADGPIMVLAYGNLYPDKTTLSVPDPVGPRPPHRHITMPHYWMSTQTYLTFALLSETLGRNVSYQCSLDSTRPLHMVICTPTKPHYPSRTPWDPGLLTDTSPCHINRMNIIWRARHKHDVHPVNVAW